MNPAHGSVSIVLHILGYAGGIIVIFCLVSGAIRVRNAVARRNAKDQNFIEIEKGMKAEDASDTWRSDVSILRPESARGEGSSNV